MLEGNIILKYCTISEAICVMFDVNTIAHKIDLEQLFLEVEIENFKDV